MRVRRAHLSDEEAIVSLYNEAFKHFIETLPSVYSYNPIESATIENQSDSIEREVWIAEIEGKVVAYAECEIVFEEKEKVLWFVSKPQDLGQSAFAVLPKEQRKGYGKFLVEAVLEYYQNKDVRVAVVLVYNDNISGEIFLQKTGFELHDVFQTISQTKPMANSTIFVSIDLKDPIESSHFNPMVVVREAAKSDVESIVEIHKRNVWWCKECSTIDWCKRYIKGEFGHRVLVADYNGTVVGVGDYYSSNGRVGIAGVLPEYQCQSIGSTLFAALLNSMRNNGLQRAFIDSGLTQEAAIRMYERFGFQVDRRQNCWVKILVQNSK